MKLCSMALLLFLLTGLPVFSVLGQQCDVVVTSRAALKQDLQRMLQVDGNISCSKTCNSIEKKIETLETELDEKLDRKLNEILNEVDDRLEILLHNITELVGSLHTQLNRLHLYGMLASHPAASCADIHRYIPYFPSGYYWIGTSPGRSRRQYCDMTRSCGGVTGGWMKVAYLDMTNSSHQCPSGLRQRTDSNKRSCVRNSSPAGCSSVTFSTAISGYSRVCGKITAYQVATPDAFGHYSISGPVTIDTYYVDGVSLTHGNPRQHIWTFAGALDEAGTDKPHNCPCTNTNYASEASPPPSFVGDDYFCDTGISGRFQWTFYGDDPLWDGAGCGPLNACCSFNNPPWFYKQLPHPTTDDIEMRVCRDQGSYDEDIAIKTVEIYVQ